MNENYKAAGVDVNAGYRAVELMKEHVGRTWNPSVLSGIGGFGGLFALNPSEYANPVLVSGTDGVGTKLKIAFLSDRHDSIGIDCVAMCVNDIICSGAKPLFFLDYIAVGKNKPEKVARIVKGVAEGCVQAGCALIGGETAEMPGFYAENEYDMAGFAVGIVDRDKIIDSSKLKPGDALIGLASSGLHSNGFSLVRKLFNITDGSNLEYHIGELGCTLKDELLKPTKIYVKPLLEIISRHEVKAVSHITGGGFQENIPRMLKEGVRAVVNTDAHEILPIFAVLQSMGGISKSEMFATFNMGIGMVLAVPGGSADAVLGDLAAMGEKACIIGEIAEGDGDLQML